MSPKPICLAGALLAAACAQPAPSPAAPAAPISGEDAGPFAPQPPADVAAIRADPRLRAEWRAYCDRIRGMAFIMIYPPSPRAVRIMADQRKCAGIFPDGSGAP